MSNIDKIRQEIERLKGICTAQIKANPGQTFPFVMEMTGYDKLLAFIDSLPDEEPSKDLEEAAENIYKTPFGTRAEDFIAGAEWQKGQDQPITGNSLEQEWLRYVDKKKKESGGELPYLGEYGWLMIAGHFANWQKEQMLKDAVNAEITVGRLPDDWSLAYNPDELHRALLKFKSGDKVRIIIVKED